MAQPRTRPSAPHPVLLVALEPGDQAYAAGARCCLAPADGDPMLFRSRDAAERFCRLHGLAIVTYDQMLALRTARYRR